MVGWRMRTLLAIAASAMTIGAVLAAGATVHSVTLNGAPVAYQLVTTHRGTAVEVSVPHPAAAEVLAVQA
jgi:hypothetical protein